MERCGNSRSGIEPRQGNGDGEVSSSRHQAPAGKVEACSACAGDYEDPERTAWVDEDSEGDDQPEKSDSDSGANARGNFSVDHE